MPKSQPEELVVEDIRLTCPTCSGTRFTRSAVTLITAVLANTGLNKSSDAAVCARCGNIQFFVPGVLRTAPPAAAE